jgi:hypothetical protein
MYASELDCAAFACDVGQYPSILLHGSLVVNAADLFNNGNKINKKIKSTPCEIYWIISFGLYCMDTDAGIVSDTMRIQGYEKFQNIIMHM